MGTATEWLLQEKGPAKKMKAASTSIPVVSAAAKARFVKTYTANKTIHVDDFIGCVGFGPTVFHGSTGGLSDNIRSHTSIRPNARPNLQCRDGSGSDA